MRAGIIVHQDFTVSSRLIRRHLPSWLGLVWVPWLMACGPHAGEHAPLAAPTDSSLRARVVPEAHGDASAEVLRDSPSRAPEQPPPMDAHDRVDGGPTAGRVEQTGAESVGEILSDELENLQSRALALCQEAEGLLKRGDVAGAIDHVDRAYALMLKLPEDHNDDESFSQAKQDIRLVVAKVIDRVYRGEPRGESTPVSSWDLGLPMVSNEHVQREIKSFTTYERELFLAAYRRSGRYRPMILEKLREAGLPSQLSWLPLVESAFKVTALSRASALGLWQFISSTGLRYGLERDPWVDERSDPEKATDAAIAYLTDLHRLFGDWPKALAAYNCGEGRIQRLQKRAEGKYMDFWDLHAQLPHETRRYVPRLIAVLQILSEPEAYGLTLPELDASMVPVETIDIEKPVKLVTLDGALGLEAGTLARLNPELRHDSTPKVSYALKVPQGHGEILLAALPSIPEYVPPKPKYVVHRVRSGETLSTIAERYRTSISAIMRSNRIRSAHRIWPGQRLRIPVRG